MTTRITIFTDYETIHTITINGISYNVDEATQKQTFDLLGDLYHNGLGDVELECANSEPKHVFVQYKCDVEEIAEIFKRYFRGLYTPIELEYRLSELYA